jgi:hypothetical protein
MMKAFVPAGIEPQAAHLPKAATKLESINV